MAKNTILNGRIDEGSYWPTVLKSLGLHLLLVTVVVVIPWLFPGIMLTPGSGGGGGGENEGIISVGLTDSLGGAGNYKPSPVVQPPAVDLPKPEPKKPEPNAIPIEDPLARPKKEKKEKAAPPDRTAARATPEEQKVKNAAKVPAHYVPTPTGPGTGGIPGLAAGAQGVGIGMGDGSGTGGGSGIGDSWYARQVEKRIGSNWLRGLVGSVPPGKFTAKVTFQVLDGGNIVHVNMEKSSGVPSLDDSAKRAIAASNPLTPLPPELRGKPVKFTALFEYPPPAR